MAASSFRSETFRTPSSLFVLLPMVAVIGGFAGPATSCALAQPGSGFRWVNPLPEGKFPHLRHATFDSKLVEQKVGYCIYLPPSYGKPEHAQRRYPVVYYLHGGRPGSEIKSAGLSEHIHRAMNSGELPHAIYVFVNGGQVSHYNYPEKNSPGEDVFVQELIPHIDVTYRTIAAREGRGLEGFSQGGRGTARIYFRHPELFGSVAAGGGGFATEKRIAEEEGRESDTLKFASGYNAYDLAKRYAAQRPKSDAKILIFVGDQDFNYEGNLAYMEYLASQRIPFEKLIVPGVPHSAAKVYEQQGQKIMRFHADNFARP